MNPVKIKCNICNKEFKDKQSMMRHKRRSKICQQIDKLPKISSNLIDEAKKIGFIIEEGRRK